MENYRFVVKIANTENDKIDSFYLPVTEETLKEKIQINSFDDNNLLLLSMERYSGLEVKKLIDSKIEQKEINISQELSAKVGENYEDTILNPALQSGLKAAMAKYTAEEMVTKRSEVANAITEELNSRLEEYFIISAVNIENIGFTDEYNKAIEAKTTNEQKAQAEKAQLEIIKVQNEQKINTAEAEAKVRELQSQSVTEKSLEQLRLEIQREMIQKWNGAFPTTMLSDDPTMLFNLGK